MTLEILSRIQFAFTITFHYIFVPLSIGLILMMLITEILHYRTKDDKYRKITDYLGNIFLVSYAIGIVTGITLTVQIGANWSEFSNYIGSVFGAPLALEALLAFFLESTFAGIYFFRRYDISPKFRLVTISLITIGTSLSALWIITANSFMQHPVGYVLADDGTRLLLDNFWEVIFNPYMFFMLLHTVTSAYLVGAFFTLSISAYKLLKKSTNDEERIMFKTLTKIAAKVALVFSLLMPIVGNLYYGYVAQVQPTKTDAISTGVLEGSDLGMAVRIAFFIMVGLGTLFILLSLYTIIFFNRYMESRTLQKIYLWIFILPYIASVAGWYVAELGRQPWIVYGLMKTSDGVSQFPTSQVVFSLILVGILYAILFIISIYFGKLQVDKDMTTIDYKYKYIKKMEDK